MARWDPGSEERLRSAALDLFTERGYDAVTAADIATRAGLTRRSFFRLFPDKREVLFGDSSRLLEAIEDGIAHDSSDMSPREVVVDVLTRVGTMLLGLPDQARRQQVIRLTPDLQERERTKIAAIGAAAARGLTARDVPAAEATVLGHVFAEIFHIAYARSAFDPVREPFPEALRQAVTAAEAFLAAPKADG